MKVMYPLALVVAVAALVGGSTPLRASETDSRIESSFKKSYVYKTYLKDEHIQISSKDGAVTLSGDVYNETHKPMAQDTAEALPGVTSVDNRIEIKGDRPTENSDTWVSMKVKTALVFHRNVNAHKTEVTVKEGVVTLKGEAASQAQKDLTTEFAKDVDGVKGVNNEMTVAANPEKPGETMGEKIDDASVTAQVKMTLLSHRSTGVLRTKVETTDGVVTLAGQARNAAEKDLATKVVEDVHGVKSVVNNMTIEEAKKE
ncbi:MAG: BON domain-containing protein [Verrucomicrobiia bacterium]